jgi:hypothetical protein
LTLDEGSGKGTPSGVPFVFLVDGGSKKRGNCALRAGFPAYLLRGLEFAD